MFARLAIVVSIASLSALAGCGGGAASQQPNLVARGIDVTWTGADRTVKGYIANTGSVASGPFMVYFDGDETPPGSSRDRPQLRTRVESLAANSVMTVDGDFSPLASNYNSSLGLVNGITFRVDPKSESGDPQTGDNVLTTVMPSAVAGGTRIYGPVLRPIGNIQIFSATSVVAQTFRPPAGGRLVGLEITANRCTNPPTDLVLTIRQGTTVLATRSLPASAFSTNCTVTPATITGTQVGPLFFDFSASPITVTALAEYTLSFTSTGSRYQLGMAENTTDLGNVVDAGSPHPNLDLAFKWFMAP